MINTNSPTTQQLELISQMSNWGDVGTITVKAMASELLSLRQQIAQMQAPAVAPAHKYTSVYTGNVVGIYKDGEQMTIEQIVSDLNTKAVEPAQAVPVAYTNQKQLEFVADNPGGCVFAMWSKAGYEQEIPLYTAPPAIDDEIRKSILELCRLIIDKAGPDSMITRAMAQKAEKISERLEAGRQ